MGKQSQPTPMQHRAARSRRASALCLIAVLAGAAAALVAVGAIGGVLWERVRFRVDPAGVVGIVILLNLAGIAIGGTALLAYRGLRRRLDPGYDP